MNKHSLLSTELSNPPRHEHPPDNTGRFPLNEEDKNWHKCLLAMEDEILFRIVKKHVGGTWVGNDDLLLIVQFVGSNTV